jgi:D-sedoheptulose 7-phosphate isomerase
MELQERVINHFHEHIGCVAESAECLPPDIAMASGMLLNCLLDDGKILVCGNGSNGANGQHFCANLLNRFQQERPSLPALNLAADSTSLTAIARDSTLQDIFATQVRALGHNNDILMALSDEGSCANVVQAMQAAHDRQMQVITITGATGGNMASLLYPDDIAILIPTTNRPTIYQLQLVILHSLCDLIDSQLFRSSE